MRVAGHRERSSELVEGGTTSDVPPVVTRMVGRAAAQRLGVVAELQVRPHKHTTSDFESGRHEKDHCSQLDRIKEDTMQHVRFCAYVWNIVHCFVLSS